MSNATASPTDALGPMTFVPLLISIGTLILVVVMMFHVYYHRGQAKRKVQFTNQLHVTGERNENLEARKVMKLELQKLEPAERRGSVQRAGNLCVTTSGSKMLFMENVEEIDRHVAATELQEDVDMSTVAECGTTYSQVSSLRDETSGGGSALERWRRQRQGAPKVTPLLMASQSTSEVRKTRAQTSRPTGQDGAHAAATKETTFSGKGATTLTDTHDGEKWV